MTGSIVRKVISFAAVLSLLWCVQWNAEGAPLYHVTNLGYLTGPAVLLSASRRWAVQPLRRQRVKSRYLHLVRALQVSSGSRQSHENVNSRTWPASS